MNIKVTLGLVVALQAIQIGMIFNLVKVNQQQNAILSVNKNASAKLQNEHGVVRIIPPNTVDEAPAKTAALKSSVDQ